MPVDYSVYLVTDRGCLRGRDLIKAVDDAVDGGVTLVQLREKDASSRAFYELAVALKKRLAVRRVPLIINDRLDIALAADADGLHIGQDDLPITEVRRILGKDKILGYSVSNVAKAVYGEKNGADYLGAGTIYATGSKADAGEPIGTGMLAEIVKAVKIPVVGIGGINADNEIEIKRAGADGISVISAILSENDIKGAARALAQRWRA